MVRTPARRSYPIDPVGEIPGVSTPQYTVTDANPALLAAAREGFSALQETLKDVPGACAALPEAEQQRYRDAQQSVVDARRSAQTNEGLLQVC